MEEEFANTIFFLFIKYIFQKKSKIEIMISLKPKQAWILWEIICPEKVLTKTLFNNNYNEENDSSSVSIIYAISQFVGWIFLSALLRYIYIQTTNTV